MGIGLLLPFTKNNGRLFESSETKNQQTKTNLRNLLLTERGERIMQPDFGVRLRRYLFEPNLPSLVGAIEDEIISSVQLWLPHVIIKDINVTGEIDDTLKNGHTIAIRVDFSLTITPTILDSIIVTIN